MKIIIYYHDPYHSGFYRGSAEDLGFFLALSGRSRLKGRVSNLTVEYKAEKFANELLEAVSTATIFKKPMQIQNTVCAIPYEYGTARGKISSVDILVEVYPLGYEPSEEVHDIVMDEIRKKYEVLPVRRFRHRGNVIAYLKVPPSQVGAYKTLYVEVFMVDDGRIYVPFFSRDFHDAVDKADPESELSVQSALLYVTQEIARCSRCPGWHIILPEDLPPWVAAWLESTPPVEE